PIEHAHRGADSRAPDIVAAAIVAEEIIPPIGAPQVTARIHPEGRRTGASDHHESRLRLGRAGPCADHIVLQDGRPAVVELAQCALRHGKIQVGVEAGDAHTDPGERLHLDTGGTRCSGYCVRDIGARGLHPDRAIIGWAGLCIADDADLFTVDDSLRLRAAAIYTDPVAH